MKMNCPVIIISAHALLCYLMLITGEKTAEKCDGLLGHDVA
jgi:hypothetical protein